MSYSVKKLAQIANISIRTLHWYDEIGLLKPAYHGANGYRYYEKEQLLLLQQILLFREMGIELGKIKKILSLSDFDKIKALKIHKHFLEEKLTHAKQLIETVDKTIYHLQGKKKMASENIFDGFSKEKQAEFEAYIIKRFGEPAAKAIKESHEKEKKRTKEQSMQLRDEEHKILADLEALRQQDVSYASKETQAVIRQHYQWLKNYWTPNKDSYEAHGQLVADSELSKKYETFHPQLPEFASKAIIFFAQHELE